MDVDNPYDFAKVTKTFFNYVTREALAALLEIVFNKLKKVLMNLIQNFVTKVVKEQLDLYIKSINSTFVRNIVQITSDTTLNGVTGISSSLIQSVNTDKSSFV